MFFLVFRVSISCCCRVGELVAPGATLALLTEPPLADPSGSILLQSASGMLVGAGRALGILTLRAHCRRMPLRLPEGAGRFPLPAAVAVLWPLRPALVLPAVPLPVCQLSSRHRTLALLALPSAAGARRKLAAAAQRDYVPARPAAVGVLCLVFVAPVAKPHLDGRRYTRL